MAGAMESDQDEDLDMTDANGTARETVSKSDTVQYGELNISSAQDTIAAGVAAGNIHLQSTDAATLALPEARHTPMTAIRPVDIMLITLDDCRPAKKQEHSKSACYK